MECIILVRLESGEVIAISDFDEADDSKVWLAKDRDEAVRMAQNHSLCRAMLYQIVELDEL